MKKIIAMISVLMFGMILFLTSCGNQNSDLPKIEGTISLTPLKNSINVKTSFVDTDNYDLFYGNVRVRVDLFSVNEDNVVTNEKSIDIALDKPTVNSYTEPAETVVKDAVASNGQFLVTFNTMGGSKIAAQAVKSGSTIRHPSIPTRSGYKFEAWYTDENCTQAFVSTTPITDNITLYANWTQVDQHTVTFVTNGGSNIDNRVVNTETTVARPTDPVKRGYYFDGWFTNEEFTTTYDFKTSVTADLSLYAKWRSVDKNILGVNNEFTSLNSGQKYVAKLMISAGGKTTVLDSAEATTLTTGQDEKDPIVIHNLDEFLWMSKAPDAYYELGSDIVVEESDSIAFDFSSSKPFAGYLDGKGHKISNIELSTTSSYIGLFNYMSGATVKNLIIENVNYKKDRSDTYLGALAGTAENCNISDVQVKNVSINHGGNSSRTSYVGGLIGLAKHCTIENCNVSDMNLTISKAQLRVYVGGLVGSNSDCTIRNCFVDNSTIDVNIYYNSYENGRCYLGGFVGTNDTVVGGIENCYAKLNIAVKENDSTLSSSGAKTYALYVGGFVGTNVSAKSVITNCAIIGKIDVVAEHANLVYVGGFAACLSNANASNIKYGVYYPLETGITVKLMAVKKDPVDAPEITPEEGTGTSTGTTPEPEKIGQKAYFSMTIGSLGTKSKVVNVIAYGSSPIYSITNQHDNTIINQLVNEQRTDLTGFSDFIKKTIDSVQ